MADGGPILEKSDAILRAFIDGSPDSICIRDRERRLLLWNAAFARSVKANCGVDICAGMRAEDYIPEEILSQYANQRELMQRTFDGEAQSSEFTYPSPDGATLFFEITWSPVREEGVVVAVAEVTRNVTAQKVAESRLRESEALLREYMDNSQEAIWGVQADPPMPMSLSVDDQIDYLYNHAYVVVANYAWAKQNGYECWQDMVGLRLDEIVPCDVPENVEHLRKLAESDFELKEFITHDLTADGSLRTVVNSQSAEIRDGCFFRIWGSHRDITEQEVDREQRRLAEDKYRSVVENANESIIVSQDGQAKFWNARALAFFGYTDSEMAAAEFKDFIHSDDYEVVAEHYRKRLAGEETKASYTIRVVTKLRETKWVMVNSTQIQWEGKPASLVLLTDITARQTAELALLEAAQKYRTVADFTYDWEYWEGPDGDIRYMSPSCERITGYARDDFFAGSITLDSLVIEQDRPLWAEHRAYVETGEAGKVEFRLRHKNGEIRWIGHECQPVQYEDGSYMGLRASNRDITSLRLSEAENLRQRDALERVSRTAGMDQLAGSIAHELNQPLTGILSNAQAGEMMIEKDLCACDEMSVVVQEIIADAKRAGDVIRNLRDIYRDQGVEMGAVDLNQLVMDTESMLHSEFVLQGVKLAVHMPKTPIVVQGNRVQLQQVLLNFLSNGVEAMRDLKEVERRIVIVLETGIDTVTVSVEDCGTGIGAERIPRIFDPLATWKPGGTGMGLAISASIINAHDGKMLAEDLPAGGARVGFKIPTNGKKV